MGLYLPRPWVPYNSGMPLRLSSRPWPRGRAYAVTGTLFTLLLALVLGPCRAQERSEQPIGPGVKLLRWTQPQGPNALFAVEVDTAQPLVRLGVSVGRGGTLGLEPISRQAERVTQPNRYPIAGINGDFFYYPSTTQPGIPTNAVVLQDEVIRTPFNRSCLLVAADGTPSIRILKAVSRVTRPGGVPRMLDGVNQTRGANQLVLYTPWYGPTTRTGKDGTEVYLEPERFPLTYGADMTARVRAVQSGTGGAPLAAGKWVLSGAGPAADFLKALAPDDSVVIRIDFDPALKPGDQVIGGGPRLVRDGKAAMEAEGGNLNGSFSSTLHPRTAVGFNGKKVYLLVVDGRTPGYSAGMSLPELAAAMADLGCTDALNLDGGGSSTLWVRGSVVNRPSDGRERAVANGLLVFSTAPHGEAVRVAPSSTQILALPGAETPLTAVGEDQYYNPVPLAADAIWSVEPASLGAIAGGRFTAAVPTTLDPGKEYASGRLNVAAGAARGSVAVRVYARPARVEVLPASPRVGLNTQASFTVRAFNAEGKPLLLPAAVQWDASPEVGAIDAKGTLATGAVAGKGLVRATVAGGTGAAQVEVVEGASRALEDFENASEWRVQLSGGAVGTAAVTEGTAHSGKRALHLGYDFSAGAGTRAVYALGTRPLGQPLALKLWVYGDGQGEWLRVRIRDAKKMTYTLDAVRKVDWKDAWREVRVPISEDIPGPVTLEAIYVVEPDAARKIRGEILIDDLGVEQ